MPKMATLNVYVQIYMNAYICIYMYHYRWIMYIMIIYLSKEFIQALLMSVRWHKKLNSLIDFSISILIKFCFQALALKFCLRYIGLLSFFYFELFICSSGVKRPTYFRSFTLWTLTKALLWIGCRTYSTLRLSSAFCNIQKLNLSSKNGHY